MPKRIPTPPPANDEPRYFAVYQGYPLHANCELKDDLIDFARWIACCIGPEVFLGVLYKPSARNMILIEIDRDWREHHLLLGMHEWSKFLIKPSDEEKNRKSAVYHSIYSSHREAQKDGWKRLNVEDVWFEGWSRDTWRMKSPYPPTQWCAIPPEDRTQKAICRHLPVASKPPPPKAPKTVPGSAAYYESTTAPKTVPGPSTPIARGGGPSSTNKKKAGGASKVAAPVNNTWNKPIHTNSKGSGPTPQSVWGKKPVTITSPASEFPGLSSRPSSTASPSSNNVWAQRPVTVAAPSRPPGLVAPQPIAPIAPPGLVRDASLASASSSSSSTLDWASEVAAESAINHNAQYDHLSGGMGQLTVSDSMEKELHGIAPDEDIEPEDYIAAYETPVLYPSSKVGYQSTKEGVTEDLWAQIERVDKKPEEPLCPTHGVICKKGICQEYSKILRQIEREKNPKAKTGGKRNGGGGGNGNGNGNRTNRNGNGRGGNLKNGGAWNSGRSNGGYSSNSSSNAGSRSVSRANSVAVHVPNHDDEAEPWD